MYILLFVYVTFLFFLGYIYLIVCYAHVHVFGLHTHTWQVFDESALSQRCKEEMYKCYPDAKRAHLKSGGNFPYLSRSTEVDLMIQVYMCIYKQNAQLCDCTLYTTSTDSLDDFPRYKILCQGSLTGSP